MKAFSCGRSTGRRADFTTGAATWIPCRAEVDVEDLLPHPLELLVLLGDGVPPRHPGVVDEQVDPAELLDRGVDERAEVLRATHIAGDGERPGARGELLDLVDHLGERVELAIGEDDVGSLECEQCGGGATHPARRSGDDRGGTGDRTGGELEERERGGRRGVRGGRCRGGVRIGGHGDSFVRGGRPLQPSVHRDHRTELSGPIALRPPRAPGRPRRDGSLP